jgi:ABC-type Fe3+-hydroxamate transport system substrate-binding protein
MTERTVCVDAAGAEHGKAVQGFRIVSLVPSLTELLCDLGLSESLVGRTGFCIHPREMVKRIPKVGGTKDVDVKKVRDLNPSHVVVNIDENTREVAAELAAFVDHVIVTHPIEPQDNIKLFDMLGFIFSAESQAKNLIERFNARFEQITQNQARPQHDVLYLIWRDPWMTISPDTYISRMLNLVGWHSRPEDNEQRYPTIELSDYVGRVSKVLLSSEPYPFRQKHIDEIKNIFATTATVSLIDGEMLSWYGSRSIAGLDYLDGLGAAASQESAA